MELSYQNYNVDHMLKRDYGSFDQIQQKDTNSYLSLIKVNISRNSAFQNLYGKSLFVHGHWGSAFQFGTLHYYENKYYKLSEAYTMETNKQSLAFHISEITGVARQIAPLLPSNLTAITAHSMGGIVSLSLLALRSDIQPQFLTCIASPVSPTPFFTLTPGLRILIGLTGSQLPTNTLLTSIHGGLADALIPHAASWPPPELFERKRLVPQEIDKSSSSGQKILHTNFDALNDENKNNNNILYNTKISKEKNTTTDTTQHELHSLHTDTKQTILETLSKTPNEKSNADQSMQNHLLTIRSLSSLNHTQLNSVDSSSSSTRQIGDLKGNDHSNIYFSEEEEKRENNKPATSTAHQNATRSFCTSRMHSVASLLDHSQVLTNGPVAATVAALYRQPTASSEFNFFQPKSYFNQSPNIDVDSKIFDTDESMSRAIINEDPLKSFSEYLKSVPSSFNEEPTTPSSQTSAFTDPTNIWRFLTAEDSDLLLESPWRSKSFSRPDEIVWDRIAQGDVLESEIITRLSLKGLEDTEFEIDLYSFLEKRQSQKENIDSKNKIETTTIRDDDTDRNDYNIYSTTGNNSPEPFFAGGISFGISDIGRTWDSGIDHFTEGLDQAFLCRSSKEKQVFRDMGADLGLLAFQIEFAVCRKESKETAANCGRWRELPSEKSLIFRSIHPVVSCLYYINPFHLLNVKNYGEEFNSLNDSSDGVDVDIEDNVFGGLLLKLRLTMPLGVGNFENRRISIWSQSPYPMSPQYITSSTDNNQHIKFSKTPNPLDISKENALRSSPSTSYAISTWISSTIVSFLVGSPSVPTRSFASSGSSLIPFDENRQQDANSRTPSLWAFYRGGGMLIPLDATPLSAAYFPLKISWLVDADMPTLIALTLQLSTQDLELSSKCTASDHLTSDEQHNNQNKKMNKITHKECPKLKHQFDSVVGSSRLLSSHVVQSRFSYSNGDILFTDQTLNDPDHSGIINIFIPMPPSMISHFKSLTVAPHIPSARRRLWQELPSFMVLGLVIYVFLTVVPCERQLKFEVIDNAVHFGSNTGMIRSNFSSQAWLSKWRLRHFYRLRYNQNIIHSVTPHSPDCNDDFYNHEVFFKNEDHVQSSGILSNGDLVLNSLPSPHELYDHDTLDVDREESLVDNHNSLSNNQESSPSWIIRLFQGLSVKLRTIQLRNPNNIGSNSLNAEFPRNMVIDSPDCVLLPIIGDSTANIENNMCVHDMQQNQFKVRHSPSSILKKGSNFNKFDPFLLNIEPSVDDVINHDTKDENVQKVISAATHSRKVTIHTDDIIDLSPSIRTDMAADTNTDSDHSSCSTANNDISSSSLSLLKKSLSNFFSMKRHTESTKANESLLHNEAEEGLKNTKSSFLFNWVLALMFSSGLRSILITTFWASIAISAFSPLLSPFLDWIESWLLGSALTLRAPFLLQSRIESKDIYWTLFGIILLWIELIIFTLTAGGFAEFCIHLPVEMLTFLRRMIADVIAAHHNLQFEIRQEALIVSDVDEQNNIDNLSLPIANSTYSPRHSLLDNNNSPLSRGSNFDEQIPIFFGDCVSVISSESIQSIHENGNYTNTIEENGYYLNSQFNNNTILIPPAYSQGNFDSMEDHASDFHLPSGNAILTSALVLNPLPIHSQILFSERDKSIGSESVVIHVNNNINKNQVSKRRKTVKYSANHIAALSSTSSPKNISSQGRHFSHNSHFNALITRTHSIQTLPPPPPSLFEKSVDNYANYRSKNNYGIYQNDLSGNFSEKSTNLNNLTVMMNYSSRDCDLQRGQPNFDAVTMNSSIRDIPSFDAIQDKLRNVPYYIFKVVKFLARKPFLIAFVFFVAIFINPHLTALTFSAIFLILPPPAPPSVNIRLKASKTAGASAVAVPPAVLAGALNLTHSLMPLISLFLKMLYATTNHSEVAFRTAANANDDTFGDFFKRMWDLLFIDSIFKTSLRLIFAVYKNESGQSVESQLFFRRHNQPIAYPLDDPPSSLLLPDEMKPSNQMLYKDYTGIDIDAIGITALDIAEFISALHATFSVLVLVLISLKLRRVINLYMLRMTGSHFVFYHPLDVSLVNEKDFWDEINKNKSTTTNIQRRNTIVNDNHSASEDNITNNERANTSESKVSNLIDVENKIEDLNEFNKFDVSSVIVEQSKMSQSEHKSEPEINDHDTTTVEIENIKPKDSIFEPPNQEVNNNNRAQNNNNFLSRHFQLRNVFSSRPLTPPEAIIPGLWVCLLFAVVGPALVGAYGWRHAWVVGGGLFLSLSVMENRLNKVPMPKLDIVGCL